jgi:hypothetical protein
MVKIVAKKDSTELVIKGLVARTHVSKPISYELKHGEKKTEFFLQYQNKGQTGDVADIVRGEKINGAAFDVEIIEVLSYPSEHESEHEPQNDHESQNEQHLEEVPKDTMQLIIKALKTIMNQRKHARLLVSPKSKKQRMKHGSKLKRKPKKVQSSDT